jgi:hypothetical protein
MHYRGQHKASAAWNARTGMPYHVQEYLRAAWIVARCNTDEEIVMKMRAAFTSCFAIALLAALPAAHAGEKKVKFSLRNDTGAPLELKIGDKVTTLKEGEVLPVKLALGTRILTDTATEHHPIGEVITVVSDSTYSNSTLAIGK